MRNARRSASPSAATFSPATRYVLELAPSIELKLGNRFDINFSVGVTKRINDNPPGDGPGPIQMSANNKVIYPIGVQVSTSV